MGGRREEGREREVGRGEVVVVLAVKVKDDFRRVSRIPGSRSTRSI